MPFTNIELHTSEIDTSLVTVKLASRIRPVKKVCNLQ